MSTSCTASPVAFWLPTLGMRSLAKGGSSDENRQLMHLAWGPYLGQPTFSQAPWQNIAAPQHVNHEDNAGKISFTNVLPSGFNRELKNNHLLKNFLFFCQC